MLLFDEIRQARQLLRNVEISKVGLLLNAKAIYFYYDKEDILTNDGRQGTKISTTWSI